MTNISDIHAREVLDSRGNPTVEAKVTLTINAISEKACLKRSRT